MLSTAASNGIVYATYMAMLISGIGIALYWRSDKSSFLSSNGTRTGIPLALNFIAAC
ncbi:unnamed protein product [Kuraishia capsulata CBS 1993]|uniref:Amino acid permease/ SLC12A domain-containing protein n=1 Tax=Kuraishia capsulata CBS 1993 TaxID=1382522 RepID=W6MKH5_9ASCO|nr:uncharacterized protein KUCA_T00001174001 [Kuraishia capsulata CBS 1993]CDK25207.1 unnamed protein product [Kuraishia capsulata CBS 1993]